MHAAGLFYHWPIRYCCTGNAVSFPVTARTAWRLCRRDMFYVAAAPRWWHGPPAATGLLQPSPAYPVFAHVSEAGDRLYGDCRGRAWLPVVQPTPAQVYGRRQFTWRMAARWALSPQLLRQEFQLVVIWAGLWVETLSRLQHLQVGLSCVRHLAHPALALSSTTMN